MTDIPLLSELSAIVGEENVLSKPEELLVYGFDAVAPPQIQPPIAVVMPENSKEISTLLQIANRRSLPIVPRGSATGLSGAAVPLPGSVIVLFNRMNKILNIDQANLTATVQPGVRTADLSKAVEEMGLFYPPDPSSMSISTIGGNVATNAGGLRGLKYGVTQDYILGLEVVLPTGEILRTGGKCKKDVAGYNLTSLFVGSEGTLGIVVEVLLRLIPLPEAQRTALAYFPEIFLAAQVVADIIEARIVPVTLEILDNISIRCVDEYANLGLPRNAGAMLLIEVDGPEAMLDHQIEEIASICKRNQANGIQVAKSKSEAEELKGARRVTLAALARRRPTTILEDVTVPRSQIPAMVQRIREIADRYNVEIAIFGHAGDGNLHPTGMTDVRNSDELQRVEAAFEEIFHAALTLGGTITGEHGVGTKKMHVLPKQVGTVGMKTMAAIKKSLDPNLILNPGKVFEL